MLPLLKILTILVVAVAMALPLAHALEWPGKARLTYDQYKIVQPIYYPGFTFAGLAEPIGAALTLLLAIFTPTGSSEFWLTVAALVSLLAMHGTYWLLTHPVNRFWLADFKLKGADAGFFAFDPLRRRTDQGGLDWTALRDRWELSHAIRAVLGLLSLVLLLIAVAL